MTGAVPAGVEFRGVTARFGDKGQVAVDDLSLVVGPGEVCVLVGPSGCGKTTTLRMVNRLVEPVAGQVLVDGQDVAAGDPVALRRRIGYVIQQIGLFPHQTVAENVATVPRLLRWPEERIRRRVDELLELIGLEPERVRGRYPSQLSGGERQRVGVARALAAEPPLLLMDEPFGAVDPIVRARLQDEFLRLQRALGTTVIFVTHDVDEAIKMGTRVAVMRVGGKLAQYAAPAELLAAPADDYVAEFLGADRALKRLALFTLRDLAPGAAGDNGDTLSGATLALPVATNLRDALAALLAATGQRAVVTDEGRSIGVVTLEQITAGGFS
jgi:osmoprotectant transport system ATP-binding protein